MNLHVPEVVLQKMEITPNELQEIITLARKSRVKNVIEIIDTDNPKKKPKNGGGLADMLAPAGAITKDGHGNQIADPLKQSMQKGNRWRDRALINDDGKLIDILYYKEKPYLKFCTGRK